MWSFDQASLLPPFYESEQPEIVARLPEGTLHPNTLRSAASSSRGACARSES